MSAISSVASALGLSETTEPVAMGIEEFDLTTGQMVEGTLRAFQYFPETVTDSKSPEWSRRSVPGGSHPIVSFINGGERVIAFTAIFTQEKNPEEQSLLAEVLSGSFSLGGSDTKHTMPSADDMGRITAEGVIPAAIAWLRSFTYPDYLENGTAAPPPACTVYMPGSGIIGAGFGDESICFVDSFIGVMTECNVTYQAFHRNGAPRIVEVSLSFVEIAQIANNWRFTGRGDFADIAELYSLEMKGGGSGGLLGALGF